MANKFKKGDKVCVISGKDKGKSGEITSVNPQKKLVTVEDINVITKHVKKTDKNAGGFVKMPAPLHQSNVALLNSSGKSVKVGFSFEADGKRHSKVRVSKLDGKVLS